MGNVPPQKTSVRIEIPTKKMTNGHVCFTGQGDAILKVKRAGKQPRSSSELMELVEACSRDESLKNIFPTSGVIRNTQQHEMYEFLWNRAIHLSKGKFIKSTGTSSSTLVGPKGIGKTTVLRSFTHVGSALIQNVIFVYVTYMDCQQTGILKHTLIETVESLCVNDFGLTIRERDIYEFSITPLAECLEEAGKYLFLIVDELDVLYQVNPNDYPNAHLSLSGLCAIGDSCSGRFAAVLCGSSANLEALIRTNKTPQLIQEFPVLHGAINLNGQKFKTRRIQVDSPVEVDATSRIMLTKGYNEDVKLARMMTFVAGTTPREIERVSDFENEGDLCTHFGEANYGGENTLSKPQFSKLRHSLMEGLAVENEDLLLMMYHDGTLDIEFIQDGNWSQDFKPLEYADVQTIWNALAIDDISLNSCLFHLADRLWISLHGVKESCPEYVYPPCVFKLLEFYILKRLHVKVIDVKKYVYAACSQALWSKLFANLPTVARDASVGALASSGVSAGLAVCGYVGVRPLIR